MVNLNILPMVPMGAIPSPVKSASKHIIRRRLAEQQPQSQTSYSYATNSQLVFDINSPSDFIDFANSYLRFNLNCTLLNGSVNEPSKYLSEGGAHCLFRTLTIETASGTLLQRIDRYNKLYALLSQAGHSQSFVNTVLHRAGDSVDIARHNFPEGQPTHRPVTCTLASVVAAGGVGGAMTLVGGLATSELEVGDFLIIDLASSSHTARVDSVVTDTSITITGAPALTAGQVIRLSVLRETVTRGIDPARKLIANVADSVVCIQPFAPLLQISEWFPLFLVRGGLRVTLTLERPEFCLAAASEPLLSGAVPGFSGANCVISNPVWVCDFLTPDQSLTQSYVDMFKGSGIAYTFMGYKNFMDIMVSGGSGTYVSNINSNVRSASHILSRLQNIRAETVTSGIANSGKSTFTCDSNAQGLKMSLNQYQYQSGSERFPQAKPISLQSGVSNAEAMIELERIFGHTGSMLFDKRFYPHEWMDVKQYIKEYESGEVVDASRFIIGADLNRDSSPFSGLDCSLAPIRAELTFAQNTATATNFANGQYSLYNKDGSTATSGSGVSDRYIHHFLAHSTALLLSSEGIVSFS